MKQENKEKKVQKRITKEKLITSAILSFAISYMLCFFEPLQIYFSNSIDFWYDIYNLAPMCLGMFAIAFSLCIISFFVFMLIHEKVWQIASLIFGILFVSLYIQGNFLASKLPTIDGNINPWPMYDYQRKYSIILWSLVAIIFIALAIIKKLKFTVNIIKYISLVLSLVFIVTNVTSCLMHNGLSDKGNLTVTTDGFFEVSKDGTNFVILMLDSVRGKEMNEILSEDASYSETFKDFTYYADTMTGYPMTMYSLYYMLSGDWFEGDESINDYYTNVLLNASIFDELESRDYTMDLYICPIPSIENDGLYRFKNFKRQQSHFKSFIKFAKLEMRLVGLKYAPYDLKKRCLALPNEIEELRETEGISNIWDSENPPFVKMLKEDSVSFQNKNSFKFVELDAAHPPFYFNENLEAQDSTGIETDYDTEIKASMKMVEMYIDKYKEVGCYDNTIFIIISDHGYNPDPIDETVDLWNPTNRQHGILFVKGLNEHHEKLQYSYAPTHHGDLPEAYAKLLDGNPSDNIFDVKEGDKRERRFMLHTGFNRDYLYEYIQTGEAGDMSTLKATGREYESIKGQVKGPK